MIMNCQDIKNKFISLLNNQDFIIDKTGCKIIEIIGAHFLADQETIFGSLNLDYVQHELQWYNSQSLYVKDIPGKTPLIWEQIADKDGKINSNYGYLIYSNENYNQYVNVKNELKKFPDSRRTSMIYTRPNIWNEYNENGKSDFICTHVVDYLIRDGKLVAHVMMRSNDCIFGYKNDRYWQKHVQKKLANELNVEVGNLIWTATSLHIYERHFNLIK